MLGYLNKPEATKEVIDDEQFFHSGDVGYYDECGRFYVVDRMKELIKVKGFQVRTISELVYLQTVADPQLGRGEGVGDFFENFSLRGGLNHFSIIFS